MPSPQTHAPQSGGQVAQVSRPLAQEPSPQTGGQSHGHVVRSSAAQVVSPQTGVQSHDSKVPPPQRRMPDRPSAHVHDISA
jgi:hypothetical protein